MRVRHNTVLVKRGVTLLLAILMTLSLLAPAFQAFAASILTVQSHSNAVKVEGTPESDRFTQGGTYKFTLKNDGSNPGKLELEVVRPSGGGTDTVPNFDPKTSISYGGLTITKSAGTDWVASDAFDIRLKESDNGRQPVVSYLKPTSWSSNNAAQNHDRNQGNVTRITRGKRINAFVTVTDTNFKFDESAAYEPYVLVESSSFTQDHYTGSNSSNDNRVTAKRGEGDKLAFDVDLVDLLYSGKGDTVKFTLGYYMGGENIEHNITVSIPGCKEYVDKEDSDKEDPDKEDKELDPLVPHVIISSYDYGKLQVVAGQVFDLNLTFTNTSDRYDLENVVMKITTPEGFSIASSSNTFYFDQLGKGESMSKTVSVQANPGAKAESHALTIGYTFQYVANDARKSGESSENISIPISQPDRFSVDELQLPTSLMVGEEYNMTLNFVNKGKAEIYNVTAELKGNMKNSGERTFVGNVESGKENSVDFFITPSEAGKLEGQILITYEDSNMNIKEVVRPFMIPVEEPFIPDPGMDFPGADQMGPVEPEKPNLFTVPNVLLGVVMVAVAGMTAYMTILKIKAKRSDFADEDL